MASLKNVTREALLTAIGEYDSLGADAFHAKYGTSPSTKLTLQHGGKSYPSKAIVAAATGLSPSDFSGGQSRLGALLERCGFALTQLVFGFAATVAAATVATAPAEAGVGVTGKAATYFASGSSTPASIRGFATIGHAIGVAATELSQAGENELLALAGSGIPVFVDSGAFSEVEFDVVAGGFKVVAPITEAGWAARLDLYARLAAVYADREAAGDLYLVAPDQVGSQEVTLARLTKYAPEVRALIEQGVRVLVAVQRGALPQADFDARVTAVLGTSDYVRALPCKKGATSVEELRAFVATVQPARLHLLGLGERNRQVNAYLGAVAAVSPSTVVTLDSNKIAASVGRQGKAPRILTAARDAAAALIAAGKSAVTSVQELGIILAFGAGFQLSLV